MALVSRTLVAIGLIGALSAGVASNALAVGEADPIVLVHQENDGSLWYNWYETPANKTFVTSSHPCWVDHDHIRVAGWGRQGCLRVRP